MNHWASGHWSDVHWDDAHWIAGVVEIIGVRTTIDLLLCVTSVCLIAALRPTVTLTKASNVVTLVTPSEVD